MGDALRQLIKARNTLRISIASGDASARQAMRSFDRMQAQKIRKPKKDQDEAEEIAERIEQLARDEDFVYETLGAILTDQQKDKGKNDDKTVAGNETKSGEPNENNRREATERQAQIADNLRELLEKLKKLETTSDLAKARMANATETAEKASGALARGNALEATENARTAAAKLHELARQLKGELAREVAAELAMARDLAEELAAREAELGQMPREAGTPSATPGGQQRGTAAGNMGERGEGGETITLRACAFDENAALTLGYRVAVTVDSRSASDAGVQNSPLRRAGPGQNATAASSQLLPWSEEFELVRDQSDKSYSAVLSIAEAKSLPAGVNLTQALRVELTAYEDNTQVDSTSLDIQILDDPSEQQNPLPDHDLLRRIASESGGTVLKGADDLTAVIEGLPRFTAPPQKKSTPVWSVSWLLALLIILLSIEWVWRRRLGMA
jgi:hypothetical protein